MPQFQLIFIYFPLFLLHDFWLDVLSNADLGQIDFCPHIFALEIHVIILHEYLRDLGLLGVLHFIDAQFLSKYIDIPSGFVLIEMVLLVLEERVCRVEVLGDLSQRADVDGQGEVLGDEVPLEGVIVLVLQGRHHAVDRHHRVLHQEVEGLDRVVPQQLHEHSVVHFVLTLVDLVPEGVLDDPLHELIQQRPLPQDQPGGFFLHQPRQLLHIRDLAVLVHPTQLLQALRHHQLLRIHIEPRIIDGVLDQDAEGLAGCRGEFVLPADLHHDSVDQVVVVEVRLLRKLLAHLDGLVDLAILQVVVAALHLEFLELRGLFGVGFETNVNVRGFTHFFVNYLESFLKVRI